MDDKNVCSRCGKTAANDELMGLCADCLLAEGLGSVADASAAGQRVRFVLPDVSDIAPLFPQLEVIEPLGCGGMGAVYKARQKNLDRFVALKILPPDIGSALAFAERFTREAKALAKLNHPNIVTIYDFGQAGELFYFLMEYVDGVNLGQLLRSGRVSPREALAIVPQICDALQYAHDAGIVHRDIKPENILLDRKGRVKVADFGLAKLVGSSDPTDLSNPSDPSDHSYETTHTSHIMGTPQYMAPEQVAHPSDVDHRADIYSLGVVFYQMLTGELPKGDFAAPSKKVVVDVRLDEVVLRAMEKRPELRYQQVSEVKTMVETITTTPPPAGAANVPPIVSGGALVIPPPETFWQMLQSRLWPPMVVRRNGQRVINWPAFTLRVIRGLLLLVPTAAIFIIGGINSHESGRLAWFGVAWLVLGLLFLSAVLAIRVLRGFSRPLNELPDLDNPVNKVTAPVASQKWQAPTMGWGHFIGYLQGITFTSPLAYKLANLSALGFLCFLGFMPLPGWKGCFGFSGFFGLIGLSTLIEIFARSKARRSGSDNQQTPRGLNLGRWQGVLLSFGLILLSVAAFVVVLKQVISHQNPDVIQQTSGNHGTAFGPVIERTMLAVEEGVGSKGLSFDTDRLVDLPANFSRMETEARERWLHDSKANVFFEFPKDLQYWKMVGNNLNWSIVQPKSLSPEVTGDLWTQLSADDLMHNFCQPREVIMAQADKCMGAYAMDTMEPDLPVLNPPITVAFNTVNTVGLMQIIGFTKNPRGVKLRYKLVQGSATKAAAAFRQTPRGSLEQQLLRAMEQNLSATADGATPERGEFIDYELLGVDVAKDLRTAKIDLAGVKPRWSSRHKELWKRVPKGEFVASDEGNGIWIVTGNGDLGALQFKVQVTNLVEAASDASPAKQPVLFFGPVTNGLQAAVELTPANGVFRLGDPITVRFHIRNASNENIYLSGGSWRQANGTVLTITDSEGRRIEPEHIFYTGETPLQRTLLKPGESAVFHSNGLEFLPENAAGSEVKSPVGYYVKTKPGRYTVSYSLHFPDMAEVPEKTYDWKGDLETASVTIEVKAAKATTAANPASAAVFGLQAERMIAATDANPDGVVAFRFENNFPFQPPVAVTGHFKDPAKIGFTPELRRWMQDENVDLLFYFDKKAYYVLSFNMRTGWAGQPKEWDTILPDCAVPRLTKMEKLNSEPAGPSIMGECGYRDGLGEVRVFRTRDGLVGFYQLRGLSDADGCGVNIRYKLVLPVETNAVDVAKPVPADDGPAFGSVMEREISSDLITSTNWWTLNLSSGKVQRFDLMHPAEVVTNGLGTLQAIPLKSSGTWAQSLVAMRAAGVDLVEQPAASISDALIALDMRLVSLGPNGWNLSAAEARAQLCENGHLPMDHTESHITGGRAYVFQTREYAEGVLEIERSSPARLRYKLVQQAKSVSANAK